MDNIIETIGMDKIILSAVIFLVIIIAFFTYKFKVTKKYRNQAVELENQMNAILSLPIQYRLGRVQGIVKNMPSFEVDYEKFVTDFEEISKFQSDTIVPLINKVDQKVYSGRTGGVKADLLEISGLVNEYTNRARALLTALEEITEVENSQRLTIIKVKEKYRGINDQYAVARFKIEEFVPAIKTVFEHVDSEFVTLEEMMNKQEFEKAREFTELLEAKIMMLEANVRDLPAYISIVKKFIPQRLLDLDTKVKAMKERGFAVENLKYSDRLKKINVDIDNISVHIKKLELETVGQGLEVITTDVDELFIDFEREEVAFGIYEDKRKLCVNAVSHVESQLKAFVETDINLDKEYVIHSEFKPELALESFKTIVHQLSESNMIVESAEFSYDSMIKRYDSIMVDCKTYQDNINEYVSLKEQIRIQEKRAQDELENIDIVLLEIKSQIQSKHLPMINESYRDYINDSYKKAEEIRNSTLNKPIDLNRLMVQVDSARDLIYKLYDNVHNLIVTAEMVEDAIVFGNRFRSSFLEVNTELTKAELLFRNGEYTNALALAVEIVEKIKPGSYETLVKNSQKSN